jgi:TonB family protein
MIRALVCAFLLAPALAAGQSRRPAFEFRGHRLGESIADSGVVDLCDEGAVAGVRTCIETSVRIGEATVSLSYSYLHGKLYYVFVSFDQDEFGALTAVLRARYGRPEVRMEPFATVGGVRTSNPIYSWRFREGTFDVRRYGSSLTSGYGAIRTVAGMMEYSRLKDAAARAAAARDLAPQRRAPTPAVEDSVQTVPTVPSVRDDSVYFESQVKKQATLRRDSPRPLYPDALRSAKIGGDVVAQFIVDAMGVYERGTFKVVRSSHDLFSAAVLEALPAMYFEPAEIGGRKVRQLVQMPFTFTP